MGIVPINNHSSVISKAVAAFQVRLENATLYLLKFLGESLHVVEGDAVEHLFVVGVVVAVA